MRGTVVEALADVVAGLRLGHPTRVGIDGRSAAGKTTLANELAATIKLRGREVLRAELDDFHRPGHKFRSMEIAYQPRSQRAGRALDRSDDRFRLAALDAALPASFVQKR